MLWVPLMLLQLFISCGSGVGRIAGHIWGHVEFKPHHTKEPYRNNSLSRSLLNTFLFDILLQVTQEQVTDTHTLRIVRVCC